MTTYEVVGQFGTHTIEADRYRIAHPVDGAIHGDLYFYEEDTDDAVAMFPAGSWHSVAEKDVSDVVLRDM